MLTGGGNKNVTTDHVGYYHSYKYSSLEILNRIETMHGIKKIITFCLLTMVLPTILLITPLYLRHRVFSDHRFLVTESDILDVTNGISSIFCSEHQLKMNGTFNAFQILKRPETPSYRKHIRLKKSMTLPDDTFEYWGFFLLKKATVEISFCSRYDGAAILVITGERNLKTCDLLDHNNNNVRVKGIVSHDQQVKITYESNAQEINLEEFVTITPAKESQKTKEVVQDTNINSEKLNETLHKDEATKALLNTFDDYFEKDTQNKSEQQGSHKQRHLKRRMTILHRLEEEIKELDSDTELTKQRKHKKKLRLLEEKLGLRNENMESEDDNIAIEELDELTRPKRSNEHSRIGITHGGNYPKLNEDSSDESFSSFENSIDECFRGKALRKYKFNETLECTDINYLLQGKKHAQLKYNIPKDGYYYFMFYSNNDVVSNDIHAIFDIFKPTLQYEKNVTKSCINKTECSFPLFISSRDTVVVEVPTRDGIDSDINDIGMLVSTCVPRTGIYAIFPISILFLVLGCAFL